MRLAELWQLISMDREHYSTSKSTVKLYFMNRIFRMVFRYRLLNFFKECPYYKLFYMLERVLYHKLCVKLGSDIPSHVKIDGGWKINHSWGIVINSKAIIGKHFIINTGAVIGGNHTGVPVLGDNVSVGAHALIIGGVHIGNNVSIGAGAIVVHDVPNNAVVVCDAAHVIKIKDTKES